MPGQVWIGELSRRYPEATFRVLAAIPGEEVGAGLVEIVSPEVDEITEEMTDYEMLTDLTFLTKEAESALVQFETTKPLLLFALKESGVPLELPFEIQDGHAGWEVTAPRDRLSGLASQLDSFGIQYTVEWIRHDVGSDQLLTDRQRELLEAAVREGYYDVPRTCSLTDLAETVDIAKSTCSETLHRAESKVITEFVGDLSVEGEEMIQGV